MGAAYANRLDDAERAIDAYRSALELAPDDARALDALGRLYEKVGAWERAIDAMTRLAAAGEPSKQVELYTRIARIQYAQLDSAADAEANLERALAIDEAHLPAMTALAKQYGDRGDWGRVAKVMERAERHTKVVIDKVRLLHGTARIYHDRLHQLDDARRLYAAVIELDPEHVEAGRPLAALYFESARWEPLSPVIEMLVRKSTQLGAAPRELAELYRRAGRCAGELGDHERALRHYQSALELDPTDVTTMIGRADLLFAKHDWEGAGKLYQTIAVSHRDAHVFGRLGAVRRELGDRAKALDLFEKALELDPKHRDTLHAVIELQEERGNWDAVVHAKRGLIAATAAVDDKVELLVEIAAIHDKRGASPQKATAAYLEALELAPSDHKLLQKLLDVYTETKQWRQAIETIRRFVALEDDLFRKGLYFHAAAMVARDELKSLDEAVAHYNNALDCFFAQPDRLDERQLARALMSFEAIDKVLTTKRDWPAQEQAYRAMIDRVPEAPAPLFRKLQVFLFDGLAEIYRSRLKDFASAASAFEIAQQLDPESEARLDGADRTEILAELYVVAGVEHADKAIEQHRRVLAREPFNYDSYRALARVYRETGQHDKRWCLANTLRFLKKAGPEDLEFCEQYRPRGLARHERAMTNDSWSRLAHADENRHITAILGASWQGVAGMNAFSHKDLGIKREDRRDLATDQLMFSRLFRHAGSALGVTLPEVYLVEDNKAQPGVP